MDEPADDLDRWADALSTMTADELAASGGVKRHWQRIYFDPLGVLADWLGDAGRAEEETVVRDIIKSKLTPDPYSTGHTFTNCKGYFGFYWWEPYIDSDQRVFYKDAFSLLRGRHGGNGELHNCRRYETLGEAVLDLIRCVVLVRREERHNSGQAAEMAGAPDRRGVGPPEEDTGGAGRRRAGSTAPGP